jgi:hypothetical protein
VFNYLARHPEICPADKETRFFLDADYPLPSNRRYHEHGPDAYLSLFAAGSPHAWRFEASPDYLYSANTPYTIRQVLANVRFIFILREPVSRLLSWYRFGRKRTEIGLNMNFDEYISIQRTNGDHVPPKVKHPAFCALQHGRYSTYLRPYLEQFGKSLLHIGFYENLQRDPLAFTASICRSVGISESYFREYRFDVMNKGADVRSRYLHKLYVESKERARRLALCTPALGSSLRQIRHSLDSVYDKINVVENRKVTMSDKTRDFILSYYKDESVRLKEMFGIDPPWLSNPPASSLGG